MIVSLSEFFAALETQLPSRYIETKWNTVQRRVTRHAVGLERCIRFLQTEIRLARDAAPTLERLLSALRRDPFFVGYEPRTEADRDLVRTSLTADEHVTTRPSVPLDRIRDAVVRLQPIIHATARRTVVHDGSFTVQDVAQEISCRLLEKIPHARVDHARLDQYVVGCAQNEAREILRFVGACKRHAAIVPIEKIEIPDGRDAAAALEIRDLVRRAPSKDWLQQQLAA